MAFTVLYINSLVKKYLLLFGSDARRVGLHLRKTNTTLNKINHLNPTSQRKNHGCEAIHFIYVFHFTSTSVYLKTFGHLATI